MSTGMVFVRHNELFGRRPLWHGKYEGLAMGARLKRVVYAFIKAKKYVQFFIR
jgi:hypothetical protein